MIGSWRSCKSWYFGKGVVVKVNKNILDIAFELPAGLKSLMANHKALKKLTN